MFFSMRRNDDDDDEDLPMDTRKKISFSSVVKKLHDAKSPSPKKIASTGTGLLSVVTTIATTDPTRKDASLSSDELVKKLFKGLGIPTYKPEVPPTYLKQEVPSAIKDYRWGAFDLPIYHDTLLSIVRPPTPPPEPMQMLLDTVPFNAEAETQSATPHHAEQPDIAHQNNTIFKEETHSISSPSSARRSQSPKQSRNGNPADGRADTADSIKQQQQPESRSSRKVSREQSMRERSTTEQTSEPSSSAPTEQAQVPQEQAMMRSSRSGRQLQQQDVADPVGLGSILEAEREQLSPEHVHPPESAMGSLEGAFTDLQVQEQVQELRQGQGQSRKGASRSFSSRATPKPSRGQDVFSAAEGEEQEEGEGDGDGGGEDSVEALLQMETTEQQRQYLKPGIAPQQQGQEQEQEPESTVDHPPLSPPRPEGTQVEAHRRARDDESLPPAPLPLSSMPAVSSFRSTPHSASTKQQQQEQHQEQSLDAVTSPPAPVKAEGKIISPSSRSVFRPTFAAPRPAAVESSAQGHNSAGALSAEQIYPPANGVLSGSPAKVKKNAFSVLEESFLHDSSPGYHVRSVNYSQLAPQDHFPSSSLSHEYAQEREGRGRRAHEVEEQELDIDINFKKFSHRNRDQQGQQELQHNDHEQRSGAKASPEDRRNPQHPRKQHAVPTKHWYMTGAYSSHSEAVEAIHKLNRVVEGHGVGVDSGDSPGSHFRIQRDLSRMQWVVESCDGANKQLILSHGSPEKEKDRYRRIVQSVQPVQHHPNQDKQSKAGAAAMHEKDWDLSPPQQRPIGGKLQVQQRREDKFLRERDAFYENNLRLIRQQLPSEDVSPPHMQQRHKDEGGVRFPPIAQAGQQGKGQGQGQGKQPKKGRKGKKKG